MSIDQFKKIRNFENRFLLSASSLQWSCRMFNLFAGIIKSNFFLIETPFDTKLVF